MEDFVKTIKFDSLGLIPVIATDYSTKQVLMLAYFNIESLEKTLKTGIACYYSRSRQSLWTKGETSGNYQKLISLKLDCDNDTILLEVQQLGPACHTGSQTCFFQNIEIEKSTIEKNLKQKIAILGSTGSIGKNTVSVILNDPNSFEVELLSCGKNHTLLLQQAKLLRPKYAIIEATVSKEEQIAIAKPFKEIGTQAIFDKITNQQSLLKQIPVSTVMLAVSGFYAINYIPALLENKNVKKLCLANKESIVCLGSLLFTKAKQKGIFIVPVDSEHNSLFNLLKNTSQQDIKSLIITASGGALIDKKQEELKDVLLQDVLKHPNWSMGKKITIDSATLANKGLELIEACRLFNVSHDKIEVYINKTSCLHAGVKFNDGSFTSFISKPDMKLHIANALYYPFTSKYNQLDEVDLLNPLNLKLEAVDEKRFKMLSIARQVSDNTKLCMAYNMFNELAVESFLSNKISFLDIVTFVENSLNKLPSSIHQDADFASFAEVFAFEADLKRVLTI